MPADHTDRRGPTDRQRSASDVHDIKALTDTGAITMPYRHAAKTGDQARAKRSAL